MSIPSHILVVDDETNIRLTLSALLRRAGYEVATAENGFDAVALLEQQPFDLLLVDLKMPGMDGMQVVDAARQHQSMISVIVLTGHGSLETAVEGLHQGIFDYLLKTTEPGTVIARVQAGLAARTQQLRQRALLGVVGDAVQELRGHSPRPQEPADGEGRTIAVGVLRLNTWRQEAMLQGRTLALTPTEFRVLLCLAERAGIMVSYTELVRCAQGYDTAEAEAGELIKPHIHHLRQKLEPDPSTPRYLLNVRGKGYLFSPIGE
ncbi:MAG: response regulator transcription factor [Roseiflexaceae bacterium]|nr:response regulator transcription factor [Roseiflexaceae bacterium]